MKEMDTTELAYNNGYTDGMFKAREQLTIFLMKEIYRIGKEESQQDKLPMNKELVRIFGFIKIMQGR